jgi:pseudaminic acid cytidylyltransferase
MDNLAIIPARGGSKRIPRKNIRDFMGKPVMAYSIRAAVKSGLFSEVMVSTDDAEIAETALRWRAEVPFLRSAENADDHATLADVVIEVISEYAKTGRNFDAVCCLLPTAPLIQDCRIAEAYQKMLEGNFDSVCPVVAFSYPIMRSMKITGEGSLKMIWPEYQYTRSQDLQPAYHDAGSFIWVKTPALLAEKSLLCKNGGALILKESEVQDIDTEEDWKLAEMKWQLLFNIKGEQL